MARLRLLRLVLFPILCYLTLVILWVALPSIPSVHGGNNGHYHQDVLQSGRRLTTAYERNDIYSTPRNDDNVERSWFGVDWQLVKNVDYNSVTLRIGHGAEVNLTSLANVAPPYIDLSDAGLIAVTARPGDLDGVMMPWFTYADACLLNWEIEGDVKYMDMRAVVVEPGVIQIWPDNEHWFDGPLKIPTSYYTFKPFLTISNVPTHGDKTDLTKITIDDMTWNVPTQTFTMRRTILRLLKPTIPIVIPVLTYLVYFPVLYTVTLLGLLVWAALCVSLIFGTTVFICWVAARRPTYDTWAQQYWLTRWLYKHNTKKKAIWGPGGLITYVDDEGGLEANVTPAAGVVQSRQICTLETPLDFFRSTAPLDDLLNTFEATRWMTRPLREQRALPRSRFDHDKSPLASSLVPERKL